MSVESKIKERMKDAVAKSYYIPWRKRWWGKTIIALLILFFLGVVYTGLRMINSIQHINKGEFYNVDLGIWVTEQQYKDAQIGLADLLTEDDPWRGSHEPLINVIAYESFGCPFCKDNQPDLNKMMDKFGAVVRFTTKDFPTESLHPNVFNAHLAAACANEQQKYWEYYDLLFTNQGNFQRAHLKSLAEDINLDIEQFNECLDKDEFGREIRQDYSSGVEIGVVGTPSYIINGHLIAGAIPYDLWEQIVSYILQSGEQR
ncbi:DsbA family protein [bacterium]|nr:DsbA family protein [bacterium]